MNVLVFDDDFDLLDITSGTLKRIGLNVAACQTLNEGMQIVASQSDAIAFAVLDFEVAGQESPDSTELILECIKNNIPVMLRTNKDAGQWEGELRVELSRLLGEDVSIRDLEIYAIDRFERNVKTDGLLKDVAEFVSTRFGSSTSVESR